MHRGIISHYRRIAYSFVALGLIASAIAGQPPREVRTSSAGAFFPAADNNLYLQVGEELTYNVSYASFDIGQIRIKLLEKVADAGKTFYKATAYIDSYKGVPFVSLHSIYESRIDESIYSHWFRSRTKKDTDWKYFIYNFDYAHQAMYIERGMLSNSRVEKRDTLGIEAFAQDGLSLYYYARANVRTTQQVNIPTVVSEQKGNTLISFSNTSTKEKIDAVDYPIDLVHFDGNAGFVGIFGLTGDFEGWFSNDDARVPILAKMKVLIGNIRIELTKWDRKGWAPPRYTGRD